MPGPGLLHNVERKYENKSSGISKRWKTSVFVVQMKWPKRTRAGRWERIRGYCTADVLVTEQTCSNMQTRPILDSTPPLLSGIALMYIT